MKSNLVLGILILLLLSCGDSDDFPIDGDLDQASILNVFTQGFEQLPERSITIDATTKSYAQYAMPTDKYAHTILGDGIEAEQLVVYINNQFYDLILDDEFVFEDIRPRLYDIDNDGELEIIAIRTHVSLGGGIAIYKLIGNELVEYANVEEIGSSNRWLNIAAINDLDNDGIVEIVWVETPHIGGILKVAKINKGELEVLSEQSQFSNHAIGERNLCLSAVVERGGQKILYVPNQARDNITGFSFVDQILVPVDTINTMVDFSQTLISQYNFENVVADEVNCID